MSISFDNLHISRRATKLVICLKMDSLLKVSENFEQVNNEFDEKVFVEFMKQITIWDFFGISKDKYLALPESEKRVKISQYYSEMISNDAGEFSFV